MITRTHLSRSGIVAVLAPVILGTACGDPQRPVAPAEEQGSSVTPRYTLSSGYQSALLGRSTVVEGFKVKRKTGRWEMDIHAKDPTDVIVASLTIQPGGHSGWHSHPGPGFVQVISGTVHFYEAADASCVPTVVSVGEAWLDRGETPHIVRNETGDPVTLLVTVFVPPGSAPRIDEPAPGNCPF
ncbi:MAG: cupin domain-containing protein [Gemmatimonadaceae bacterium]